MQVFLIGYMGVGKTTIGKKLAKQLAVEFIDIDDTVEQVEKASISSIINSRGEHYFRTVEKRVITQLSKPTSAVISTGGGAPCYNNVMDYLLSAGIVVWLEMPEMAMIDRLKNSKNRPLIAGKSLPQLEEFVIHHYATRVSIYQRAHITFNALSVNSERIKRLAAEIKAYSM